MCSVPKSNSGDSISSTSSTASSSSCPSYNTLFSAPFTPFHVDENNFETFVELLKNDLELEELKLMNEELRLKRQNLYEQNELIEESFGLQTKLTNDVLKERKALMKKKHDSRIKDLSGKYKAILNSKDDISEALEHQIKYLEKQLELDYNERKKIAEELANSDTSLSDFINDS